MKQDRNGVRTPADVERRHKFDLIETTAEEINILKEKIVVDSELSTTSSNAVENRVITEQFNVVSRNIENTNLALETKVDKEEGKELSSNDFTLDYMTQIEKNKQASHTHTNKSVLDSISTEDIERWDSANTENTYTYNLGNYKVSGLTILRSSCIEKNSRVCINFVGTLSISANTTTTLFNLPSAIRPMATKDFVVFGQSSNTDGYIGYGYITNSGLLEVRFNVAISSYMRFSVVYDLD